MEDLKAYLAVSWAGNTTQSYLISVGIILAGFIAAIVARGVTKRWLRKWAEDSKTQIDDIALELIDRPLYWLLIIFATYQAVKRLALSPAVYAVLWRVALLAGTLVVVIALSRLLTMVFETYGEKFAERTESKMDDQVLPILRRLSKVLLWTLATLLVLDNIGFDVMTLITGLGIGGLAIAMAAKETIAHLLGGITIFVDQPFRVGDSVNLSGTSGKVEEVGLRTTRVRTWEGNLVIIPNATTANSKVENISERPKIRVRFILGLHCATPVDKCRAAVDGVVEAIQGATETTDEPVCQFVSFSDSAFDFQVTYYVPASASLNDVKHAVNLAIVDALGSAGVSLAFPTVSVDLPERMPVLTAG